MRITYIGLSCFMIENNAGFRILVDPFNNAPEWSLGLEFPAEFNGQPFGANIVLMTEPDADHAYAPGDWLQNAPPIQKTRTLLIPTQTKLKIIITTSK